MSLGVYIGRFSPLHLGHEFVINKMLNKYGYDNSLVIIGSSNSPQDERHLFTYRDRCIFLNTLYPLIHRVGLPDYNSDEEWLDALEDITYFGGHYSNELEFFSGCSKDIEYLISQGHNCTLMDRFDGSTPLISATQVREALKEGRSINHLVNPKLVDLVMSKFAVRNNAYQEKIKDVDSLRTFRN